MATAELDPINEMKIVNGRNKQQQQQHNSSNNHDTIMSSISTISTSTTTTTATIFGQYNTYLIKTSRSSPIRSISTSINQQQQQQPTIFTTSLSNKLMASVFNFSITRGGGGHGRCGTAVAASKTSHHHHHQNSDFVFSIEELPQGLI
ncbi:hypothetical protein DERP_009211 [Dermatophagoides pteronyssinus]|uniref:Uncharacterized protein n=1 Tax=Dermatophagoides pteronyssinus TaxID=6956 RepID=A0ABQ8JQU3_DERPT|nr:hypothetical protein DERP_009211 [Dermatophagoides pteronyssinus]